MSEAFQHSKTGLQSKAGNHGAKPSDSLCGNQSVSVSLITHLFVNITGTTKGHCKWT